MRLWSAGTWSGMLGKHVARNLFNSSPTRRSNIRVSDKAGLVIHRVVREIVNAPNVIKPSTVACDWQKATADCSTIGSSPSFGNVTSIAKPRQGSAVIAPKSKNLASHERKYLKPVTIIALGVGRKPTRCATATSSTSYGFHDNHDLMALIGRCITPATWRELMVSCFPNSTAPHWRP